MKRYSIFLVLLAAAYLFSPACKKKEEENIVTDSLLGGSYTGGLKLLFSNTYPAFMDSTEIPVQVDMSGKMTFGTGTLQYSGEDNNGQSKIRREGTLNLAPDGHAFMDQDEIYFAVDENTTVDETFTVWIWDGSSWMQTVNQDVSDTWNDGLSFKLSEAEFGGSIVQVSNANGTVKWTLYLVPDI